MLSSVEPSTPVTRRGLMLVLSSPSGAGKSTLARKLMAGDGKISMSVSLTTRPPRPGEVDGEDYYFVTKEKFASMRENGELLEWAEVFGNWYATPRAKVEALLDKGEDVLFDIDWQGTQQLAQAKPQDLVRIFILPPSADSLRQRLISRNQDSASVVAKRMAEAADEISHWAEYDYVLINDDLERAHQGLLSILHAERLKRTRRVGLTAFTRNLIEDL
ncbi:MAG: guanylate kinase [Hyphomicrobiales bacterium]